MNNKSKCFAIALTALTISQTINPANAQPRRLPTDARSPVTEIRPTVTSGTTTMTLPNGVVVNVETSPTVFVRPTRVPTDTTLGEGACCCPWWEGKIGDAMTPVFPNGASSPYTINIAPMTGLNDQMAAYLRYINAVEPTITQISINWTALDLGTAATAATAGTPVATAPAQALSWSLASGTVTNSIPSFWSGTPFNVGTWYGYITTIAHNGNQTTPFMKAECATNFKPFRWAGVFRMTNGQSAPTGEVQLETIASQGQVVRSQPVMVMKNRPIRMRELQTQRSN
jgi:hypothetical protein